MRTGYYMRGVALAASWSNREIFESCRCVYRLFEAPQHKHISWGHSRPIPQTPNHGWNVFDLSFAANLIEVMETDILLPTAHITKGADFLDYLNTHYMSSGWQNWGRALAHIHMGDLGTAHKPLKPDVETIMTRFPPLQAPGTWGHNPLELYRLIETDPAAIPAHCEATALRSVEFNKLGKFWEAVPFVYDRDLQCSIWVPLRLAGET